MLCRSIFAKGRGTFAHRLLARSHHSGVYSLEGTAPKIHPDAWIAPNAVVVGNVVIGARSSVWFGACIRGDRDLISVGEDTNIQDGTILHTDAGVPMEIQDRVTIGHLAMLHGCKIHSNTLIGIGATILNNAVIGKNCLIGANALITEGKVIPDGSLVVGRNQIVRPLTEKEIAGLHKSAMGYVQNQGRYRTSLKAV